MHCLDRGAVLVVSYDKIEVSLSESMHKVSIGINELAVDKMSAVREVKRAENGEQCVIW